MIAAMVKYLSHYEISLHMVKETTYLSPHLKKLQTNPSLATLPE